MDEVTYIINIKIHRDRSFGLLNLSQRTCISRILERFGMKKYFSRCAPIIKDGKLNKFLCLRNEMKLRK